MRDGAVHGVAKRWRRRGLAAMWMVLLALVAPAASALQGKGFEHYTLALTWHAGFCETHSQPPQECRDAALGDAHRGFVLHGLWPSLPEHLAARGVDRPQWWKEGCFLEQPRVEGSFCRTRAPFDFPGELSEALDEAMPGRASCLDRYQYAKHAACLALPEADYFSTSIVLLERVNESAFGTFVALNQGGEVARNELIAAFEAAFGEGTGRALRLECRGRGNRVLTEVRIGIDAQRLSAFPAADSLVEQGRGRCHSRVRIATRLGK
ncbi:MULTISPECIES: ribonuclease I [Halomonadaceae]|uniref:ribonuclease T2 family protein n=1 Tax=Halomonadaceae TaxID=28256 RepID=UPI00159A6D94|nr:MULTISPECIES: ribonuclease I [Halomonas]QJQ96004.1 ribonuclease I [Halomonas sp. PA5]